MAKYVALLRGINVGGHNRVPMETLREILSGLGGADVRTHLQSGNAVFGHAEADPDVLARALRDRIAAELGLTIACLVRTGGELRRVVDDNPFPMAEIDPARFLVTFLSGPADPARLADLDPAAYLPEEFRLGEREVYLHLPSGVQKARLSQVFSDRRLGVTATARNWNTVTKLAALAAE